MRLLSDSRRRWYLLAALWASLLILGIGGFIQQAAATGNQRSTLDTLYLTVQLAALDYKGGDDALNWRLEVARFVAPLMAATTLLQTASVVFRDQFARLRLRFLRHHVIVCGLGGAGSRLAIALQRAGQNVVGVERDATAPGITTLRAHEVPVVIGDATDPHVLRATRLGQASRVVTLCGGDAANVAVAATVQAASKWVRRSGTALRCSVHLADTELCGLLRASELGGAGDLRIEFFNLHERAARTWLAEHPPFGDGSRPPHVIVIGLGQLGRSMTVAIAQRWADANEGAVHLTLVDRAATGRWHALRLQHPALPTVVDATILDIDLDEPTGDVVDAFTSLLLDAKPTAVAVAFEDESLALSTALLVHQVLRDPEVEIVVRTNADTGLGGLVAPPGQESAPFPGLSVFPFLDKACTPGVVEGGVREQLAQGIHEDYLSRAGTGTGLRQAWDDLDDEQRESSRRAADGIVEAMGELGFELVPLRHWGGETAELLTADLKKLARWEHERWCAERAAAGWTWGAERDDEIKLNPLLLPWDELSPEVKATNVAAARALPKMLARAGFEPLPR